MNRRAALFLLLYLAAILYLSLYPWRFVPNRGPKTFYWVPLLTRGAILDAFLNVVFYMPLGAAAFVLLRRKGKMALVAALAFGTLVSFIVEWAQLWIPRRVSSWNDLLSNSAGTLLGAMVAFVISGPILAPRLRALNSPSVLLLGLWAVWQAFLFLPQFGPSIDFSHEIVGVLILTLLLTARKIRVAAPLLLIWLIVEELRPFQFRGPAQPFGWLPFEGWFAGSFDAYYGILFGKLFLYTGILWVERRAGIRWIWTLAAPGVILTAGEFAQTYLPGRTPEITDLVLLIAGAVLLRVAEP